MAQTTGDNTGASNPQPATPAPAPALGQGLIRVSLALIVVIASLYIIDRQDPGLARLYFAALIVGLVVANEKGLIVFFSQVQDRLSGTQS